MTPILVALVLLVGTAHGASMRVHWTQTGCPIVDSWSVLCFPVGGETHEDFGRIGNTAPTPDTCDLTVDLEAGERAGSWVCWMHAIRTETGEWSPASNTRSLTFGVGATTTTVVATTVPTTSTSSTSTSTTSSTAPTSTTTSTTLRFEFRAPVVIEIHPL